MTEIQRIMTRAILRQPVWAEKMWQAFRFSGEGDLKEFVRRVKEILEEEGKEE